MNNEFDNLIYKVMEDVVAGGLADRHTIFSIAELHNVKPTLIRDQLTKGIKVEMEHTKDSRIAREVAMDHLVEDPKYYDKLADMEA